MPDRAGRTQSCQACHPNHWQEPEMNDFHQPIRATLNKRNPPSRDPTFASPGEDGSCAATPTPIRLWSPPFS